MKSKGGSFWSPLSIRVHPIDPNDASDFLPHIGLIESKNILYKFLESLYWNKGSIEISTRGLYLPLPLSLYPFISWSTSHSLGTNSTGSCCGKKSIQSWSCWHPQMNKYWHKWTDLNNTLDWDQNILHQRFPFQGMLGYSNGEHQYLVANHCINLSGSVAKYLVEEKLSNLGSSNMRPWCVIIGFPPSVTITLCGPYRKYFVFGRATSVIPNLGHPCPLRKGL